MSPIPKQCSGDFQKQTTFTSSWKLRLFYFFTSTHLKSFLVFPAWRKFESQNKKRKRVQPFCITFATNKLFLSWNGFKVVFISKLISSKSFFVMKLCVCSYGMRILIVFHSKIANIKITGNNNFNKYELMDYSNCRIK